MSARTVIRGAWVVAYVDGSHALVRNGSVVVDGNKVSSVEQNYEGRADIEIDALDDLVCPGLIDLHVHNGTRATHRIIADAGRKDWYGQPFWHFVLARPGTHSPGDSRYEDAIDADRNPDELAARFTVAELLRNGTTTFFEVGTRVSLQEDIAETVSELGIRAYLGPGYQDSHFQGTEDGRFAHFPMPEEGTAAMQAAVDFVERIDGTAKGRIRGALVPRDIESCSPDLLRETVRLKEDLDVPIQIHAAYSPVEWFYVVQHEGCTPIELLERVGLLGQKVIIGHGNFPAEDVRTNWAGGRDLEILGSTGTTVAHSPINIMRRGRVLDSFDRYRKAGINMAMGTDTFPRDLIMNMRMASYMGKIVTGNFEAAAARDVFNAATLGGAHALGRDDLGRITPGAQADIITIKLRTPSSMRHGVVRDPINAIVDCGIGDDVTTVIVDGVVRMRDCKIPGIDFDELQDQAQDHAERWWATVQEWDTLGETAEERCPWSYPIIDPSEVRRDGSRTGPCSP